MPQAGHWKSGTTAAFADASATREAVSVRRVAPLTGVALAVALLAAAPLSAQEVAGRVLDRERKSPLPGAVVRVTALDTRSTAADTADRDGRYSVRLPPGAGPWTLHAERAGYVSLTLALGPGGASLSRDVLLSPLVVPLAPVVATRTRPDRQAEPVRAPGGSGETTLSWSGGGLPLEPGDLAGVAALVPGVQSAGGGLSFFGQDPSQTRTTLDGAGFGATSLPQEALASVSVVTSTYDVSRGQFSGGMVAARTLSGTNLFGGAVRLRGSGPGLQWRPVAGPGAPASSYRYVDAAAGGPLLTGRLFWYGAANASLRSAPAVSLEASSPATLAALGVSPDSAAAVLALLGSSGVTPAARRPESSLSTRSGLLRLDYDLSSRHSLMLRLDGHATALGGLGAAPLASAGALGEVRQEGGGALAQLTTQGGGVDNELRAYRGEETERAGPERAGAAAVVHLESPEAAGAGASSAVLRFGNAQPLRSTRTVRLELADELRLAFGRHQLRAGGAYEAESAHGREAGGAFGSFSFSSLADLRAGQPAAFTRTLGAASATARTRYGSLYLGDEWKARALALTYGARLEARAYGFDAPRAEAPFGLRPGRVPSELGVSPRVGWSYSARSWSLRGGVGEFRGVVPAGLLAPAFRETGAPGELRLVCVGPAAPRPDWAAYAADPATVPEECAGGAPAFTARAPAVTVFAPGFAAPRTWHGSAALIAQLLPRVRLEVETSVTRGLRQGVALDRNVIPEPAFGLGDEGGRPVYAPAASVDPVSGGAAPAASRMLPEWGTVREIRASGRSTALQGSARLNLEFPRLGTTLTTTYTRTRVRDDAGPLPALSGTLPWATDVRRLARAPGDFERPHDLVVELYVRPRPWFQAALLGRLTSGVPYTPMVDGDVNADGVANDPAFVFVPSAVSDTALATAMRRLLDEAPEGARACLRAQLGSLAGRNSCRGPWTSSLDLRVELQPWRRALGRRLKLAAATGNALTLVDAALHGAGSERGWGGASIPDRTLLRVRGFDAGRRAYLYEVNPEFGAPDRSLARLVRPFSLTLEARLAVGSDPSYQPLERLLNQAFGAGRPATEIRQELSQRIPNLPAQVLALDSVVGLELTPEQRTRLRAEADTLGQRLVPLADTLAATLSTIEAVQTRASRSAWNRVGELSARVQAELDASLLRMRALLTAAQWARIPEAVRVPSRQLIPPRRFAPPR
jgi:Carboxypeptidase regulatory-like domain